MSHHASLAGVNASFLDEQRARSEARAARFAADAAKPPPPLPKNRITISSGKVAKPKDEAEVLTAFIRRKFAAQAILDAAVLEKAHKLGIDVDQLAREVAAGADHMATAASLPTKKWKRSTCGGLDDDLADYWHRAPPAACSPRESTHVQASVVTAPKAVAASKVAAAPKPAHQPKKAASTLASKASTDFQAAAVASSSVRRSGRITKAHSRRWRLGYLLLARKTTLATCSCRAFFFRRTVS